jgi:hypothetical protein
MEKAKILIVEDEAIIAMEIESNLKGSGMIWFRLFAIIFFCYSNFLFRGHVDEI